VIEDPLPDGGRVDVSVTVADRRIACEISVTTAHEQELGNIEKCLAAGYAEVVLVAAQERHLKSLQKFITPHLEETASNKVRFLSIEDFIGYLDELSASIAPTESTVRGYKVRVTRKTISEDEAVARRQAIAQVIARSLRQIKED